ncbi:hypothetical protein E2C01_017769 [Portunus trituberculatus]|uniref:Uncharacterized protein n=1 Tax=Portunus trituberculatus TaxID=210409 RepID=A0A5B7DSU8_PORTR|nr:hypothetical protein [Portunus trituberculatus]
MVTIPPYVSSSEVPRRPEVPNPEDRLVTFQSVLDDHQPPEAPLLDDAATTASPLAPEAHVTSYSGVRESMPPRPPVFRFPLDKFRFPARPPTSPPTTRAPPSIWDMLTTRKPLILNTELVTTTSTDVQFGLPGLLAGHTSSVDSAVTPRPVYRPTTSSLAPVYHPTTEAPLLGPVHQSSGAPESLREFSGSDNYVTVPVISGSSVRYMVVNKTRPNYPNVVIVNLQTTPEDTEGTEDTTTTPSTPTRGESRHLNSRFLEDAFKAILQKTNYWGVDDPPEGDAFLKRQGRPVDLDAQDSSTPVVEDDSLDSVSLWTFLRNLSDVYLSDPAVTQQLREFEEAALAAAQQEEEEEPSHASLTSPLPDATSTSTGRPILRYLQNQGSDASLIHPYAAETNTTSPRLDYRYISLRSEGLRQQHQQQQPGVFTPYMGTPLRHRPVMVELPNMPHSPATPLRPSFPFHLPAAEPYTTLFVTGADSSSLPQIISISSRSPGSGGATTNSPIHTFVLKDGQTMEELLQEIFDTISLEEENETYSSTEPPSTTNTQTTTSDALLQTTRDEILQSINRILYRHLYFMTTTTTTTMLPFIAPFSTTARSMEAPTPRPAEDTSPSAAEDDGDPVLLFVTRAPDTSTTTTPATTPTSTSSSTSHRPLPPRPSRPLVMGKPPYFHLGTPRPSYFTLRPTRPAPTTTTETPTTSTTHNYDLELFPVMTRPMSPVRPSTTAVSPTTTSLPPTKDSYEILDDGENEIKTTVVGAGMGPQVEERTETSVDVSYSVHSGTTEHFVKNHTRPSE